MSRSYAVVEATRGHVLQVARRLRGRHVAAIGSVGLDVRRALLAAFDGSAFRRAWLIDGRPEAVGGISGTMASSTGVVWLALTDIAETMPRAVVREARRQISEIMATKQHLETAIVVGDAPSWRFAEFLGFRLKHPSEDRLILSDGLKRRALGDILAAAPEFRVALAGGVSGILAQYGGGVHG